MSARLVTVKRMIKVGDSTTLTLPPDILAVTQLRPGDRVWVYLVGDIICLQRLSLAEFSPGVVEIAPPRAASVDEAS